MRDLLSDTIETARRSGDRIGVDGRTETSATLGAELIRLARLATSIHLAESALTPGSRDSSALGSSPNSGGGWDGDRTVLSREGVR